MVNTDLWIIILPGLVILSLRYFIGDRRRSLYIEEPMYIPHPMIYEPVYGAVVPPAPPGYLPPPRCRMSLPYQPDYVMAGLDYGKPRKQSR